jgi:hypothetical protein
MMRDTDQARTRVGLLITARASLSKRAQEDVSDDLSPRQVGVSDPVWQKRWQLLGSGCAVTFAVVVVLMTSHKVWHWQLFVWGLVIGIAGLAVLETVFLVIIRNAERATDEQRERLKRRQIIYVGEWLFIGAVAGES